MRPRPHNRNLTLYSRGLAITWPNLPVVDCDYRGRHPAREIRLTLKSGQVRLRAGQEIIIGRKDFPYFTLSETISREHLAIGMDSGGGLYVRDLASKNGTFVEGVKIPPMITQRVSFKATIELCGVFTPFAIRIKPFFKVTPGFHRRDTGFHVRLEYLIPELDVHFERLRKVDPRAEAGVLEG